MLTVSELCRTAGVTRSAYYNWLSTKDLREEREKRDLEDFLLILEAYQFRGYDKGVWGIHMRLLRLGIRMNHKKIRRLMRKYDLRCPIRQANPDRQIMKELRTSVVADNKVKREFKEHGARMILLTDITYIPTIKCVIAISLPFLQVWLCCLRCCGLVFFPLPHRRFIRGSNHSLFATVLIS